MDAQSYLMSLGWAGPGHPLHPSAYKQKGHRGLAYNPNELRTASTGSGLIKPLLVSRKENNLGLGRRAHEPQQGNEWWLKGFERALGDIGKSESERSSSVSTPVNGSVRKHAGLYSFFVKGQQMEGTMGEDGKPARRKKRKSDAISTDEPSDGSDALRNFENIASFLAVRDKDKEKRQQHAKSTPQEEFQRAGEYFEVRDATSKGKRESKKRMALQLVENEEVKSRPAAKPRKKRKSEALGELDIVVETREERRERRRIRRKEKEARTTATLLPQDTTDKGPLDQVAAKAVRKEERGRRKVEKAAPS